MHYKTIGLTCVIAAMSLAARAQASVPGGPARAQASGPVGATHTPKGAPRAQRAPYLNPALPLEVRVHDLIARMSLEEKVSEMINNAAPIPRLQVPSYDWWSEALHGVARSGVATMFPEPIGMAATFDDSLIHALGRPFRMKPGPCTTPPSKRDTGNGSED